MKSGTAVFVKDMRSELRTRYAVNGLLLFVLTAVSVILFALRSEKVTSEILAGLFWVVMFFASGTGLSRTFVSEEEKGTALTLQMFAPPLAVFFGKFLYNCVLALGLNLFISVLYLFFFPAFEIKNYEMFAVVIVLGSLGFASASTIIAAIIAKANAKGTLYPILSFPVVLPLLMTIMNATARAIEGQEFVKALPEFQVLISYIAVVLGGSYILFDYVWKD